MKQDQGRSPLGSRERDAIVQMAERIIKISRAIDYQRLPSRSDDELDRLKKIISLLDADVNPEQWEALLHRASGHASAGAVGRSEAKEAGKSETGSGGAAAVGHNTQVQQAQLQRHKAMMEFLQNAGFDKRLGRVYDTTHPQRRIPAKEIPHRKGLPAFDMVVVPDFSPVDGLHGIFINPGEIVSAVLPAPGLDHLWQVRQRKPYYSNEEMVEIVTLMSAGFDV